PNDGSDWHESLQSRRATIERLAEEHRHPQEEDTESADDHRSAITDVLRRLHEHVDQKNGDADAFEQTLVALAKEALAYHVDPQHPRLLSALKDQRDLLENHPTLRPFVRALRAQDREETLAEQEENDPTDNSDNAWPYREHTEGKTLAIIGGNRRSE